MAFNSKYFLQSGSALLDLNLDYPQVSTVGQDIQIFGSADVDRVFVRPGTSVEFLSTGAGADKLYLAGNMADYALAVDGNSISISRGADSSREFARVSASNPQVNDIVVFGNGSVTTGTLFAYLSSLATPTHLPVPVPTGETSLAPAPASIAATSSTTARYIAYAATTFAPIEEGASVIVYGSGDVDKVYVNAGGSVDASALGGSQDLIFLTGRWADYTKTTGGTQLIFDRDVGAFHEHVVVSQGNGGSSTDKLIFADGAVGAHVAADAVRAAATAGIAVAALATLAGYDASTFTPGTGPHLVTLSLTAGEDALVNGHEAGIDIAVSYGNMRAGDVVQLKLGTTNLGVAHTVSDGEASLGTMTLAVARADLGADGAKSIVASVAGMAGSALSPALLITVDTALPVTPLLSAVLSDLNAVSGVGTAGAVSVVAEADSSVRVLFMTGTVTVEKLMTGTGIAQPVVLSAADLARLGDGTVSVQAFVTDRAGNLQPVGGSTSFVLDRMAPAAPTLAAVAGDDVVNAAEQNVVLRGTTEAGSTVALKFGAATVAATVSGTDWAYTLRPVDVAALGQGATSVQVVATDRAGNTSAALSHALTVDTIAPHAVTIERGTTASVDSAGNTNSRGTLDFIVTFDEATVLRADVASNWVASFNGTTVNGGVTAAASLGAGRFRVSVDASKIGAVDGPLTVALAPSHTVTDAAGNPAALTAVSSPSSNYVIDHFDVAPVFASATRSVSFAENSPTSLSVVTGGATDADLTAPNNLLTYSLGGADVSLFNIDTATGAVMFAASPDFESSSHGTRYSLTLVATDGAGRSAVQALTIDISDANDAPVVGSLIASQVAGIGQPFSFTIPAGSFVDADAVGSANHALTWSATLASGAALPAWLHLDSSTGTFTTTGTAAGAPVTPTHLDVSVTATDGGVVPLSASQTFGLDVVTAVTLGSSVAHVSNLDVGSSLVLTSSEAVGAVAGKYIHVVDLGASLGAANGYGGEHVDHTQTIAVTDASQVQIIGNRIVINPGFDLDLSSNYSITVDDGAFTSNANHLASVAVGSSDITFSTVTPVGGAVLANAAASVAFDSATGQLHASYNWWSIEGAGTHASPTAADLSGGKIAMVFKDWNDSVSDAAGRNDGVGVNLPFDIRASNFSADDLIYIDDQSNNPLQANLLQWLVPDTDGIRPSTLLFDAAPGVGTLGGASIEVSLAGSAAVFTTLQGLNDLLGTTQAVISA